MTAIVGIQGKGWAVLAADSMTTYTDKPYIAKGYDKIVKVNEYLIAVAGDAIYGVGLLISKLDGLATKITSGGLGDLLIRF